MAISLTAAHLLLAAMPRGQRGLRNCLGESRCELKCHRSQWCWWFSSDSMHNWNWAHAGVPHKVSVQPIWCLSNQRRACAFTTHVQRCIRSPCQPSLPLCTSMSSLGLSLSSSCTWFSRPYPTALCCSGPQHPAPGGLPDIDGGAAERSSAPEWRAGVLHPPPGADRSLHLQPGKGSAQLSVCCLFVWTTPAPHPAWCFCCAQTIELEKEWTADRRTKPVPLSSD